MKRTPLKRKRATPRRTTSPRCASLRCNKPGSPLCVTHTEQRADRLFSLYVRNRDGACTANFPHDCDGFLQAAHIIGRRNQSVRYDPRNVHALCRAAHMLVDQHGREGIKYQWALSRIGFDAFLDLTEESRAMTKRKDAAGTALAWLEAAA